MVCFLLLQLYTTTGKNNNQFESFLLFRNFPPLRFGGFFMGVLGGVYVWKVENGEIDYGNDDSSVLHLVFTIFPVKCINCLRCFGHSNKNELVKEPKTEQENKDERNAWIKKVDFCMGICAIGTTVLVTMGYVHRYHEWFGNYVRKFLVEPSTIMNCINQYALNHCFVVALIGLCQDRNSSYTSKILSIRFLRWIGKMSFHLYVIHRPILQFLRLSIDKNLIPIEFKPVVFILAPMLAAYVMRKIYDEPVQSLFK